MTHVEDSDCPVWLLRARCLFLCRGKVCKWSLSMYRSGFGVYLLRQCGHHVPELQPLGCVYHKDPYPRGVSIQSTPSVLPLTPSSNAATSLTDGRPSFCAGSSPGSNPPTPPGRHPIPGSSGHQLVPQIASPSHQVPPARSQPRTS